MNLKNKVIFSFDRPEKRINRKIIEEVLKGYSINFMFCVGSYQGVEETSMIADAEHLAKIKELCFTGYSQDSIMLVRAGEIDFIYKDRITSPKGVQKYFIKTKTIKGELTTIKPKTNIENYTKIGNKMYVVKEY